MWGVVALAGVSDPEGQDRPSRKHVNLFLDLSAGYVAMVTS